MIDGEIVVLDGQGATSFAHLKVALSEGAPDPLHVCAFDLSHLGGQDLGELPLVERKQHLGEMLAGLPPDHALRLSDHPIGSGSDLYRQACRLGAEGVVAKRVDAHYRSGAAGAGSRSSATPGRSSLSVATPRRRAAGSGSALLLLGLWRAGELVYVGRVGTGRDARTRRRLREALDPLRVSRPPFAQLRSAARRGARRVRPACKGARPRISWPPINALSAERIAYGLRTSGRLKSASAGKGRLDVGLCGVIRMSCGNISVKSKL